VSPPARAIRRQKRDRRKYRHDPEGSKEEPRSKKNLSLKAVGGMGRTEKSLLSSQLGIWPGSSSYLIATLPGGASCPSSHRYFRKWGVSSERAASVSNGN
jgi:hypothetical protein